MHLIPTTAELDDLQSPSIWLKQHSKMIAAGA